MRRLAVIGAVAGVVALPAAQVGAAGSPTGYDGHIPFECELQQAGAGTDFPHPDADPFCVEYEKKHQNVTQLGVVEFLAKEPARVSQAGPKCWYYQRDHWTGYVVQDDGRTQTYNWDGSYFYDKARGLGGVYVENFTINGKTGDPRTLPGFPDEWKPYFGPGRGGVQTSDTVRAQPDCVAKEKHAPAPGPYKCSSQSGKVGGRIGPLRLGAPRKEAEDALGPPARRSGALLRWCLADGGKLEGGYREGELEFALTTSPAFEASNITVGDRTSKARKRIAGERKLTQRGSVAVFKNGTLLLGADRKRVRFIAIVKQGTSGETINAWLKSSF
jgi:hypothetical protein